jgi:CheY-like chemotaxis protein
MVPSLVMRTAPDRFGYPDFSGKSVLIIDDHQDSLDFLAELLRFCGAEVFAAPSTAQARAYLRSHVPSLIICDFQMPRETGIGFIQWLRSRRDDRADVPAIAVTAYPEDFLKDRDQALSFDAYFVKPIEAPGLLKAIGPIIARPQAGRRHLAI